MTKIDVIQQIQASSDLLSMPQAISELLVEMEKPDFSPDALSTIVLKDPSLTTRILRMANSSYYQRYGAIKTVHHAVQVLGITTVKMMALSSSILNTGRLEKLSGVDAQGFFTNILLTAAASEGIAKAIGYKAPEEAFIGGLLHDIGILMFLNHYPEVYRAIVKREIKVSNLIDAERSLFDTDHAEVGFHIATKWQLPESLAIAIRDHHDYNTVIQKDPLVNIIQLATLLTDADSFGYNMELEDRLSLIARVSGLLGLTKEQVDEISSSMMSEVVRIAAFMGVDIGAIDDMLVRANKEIWKTYLLVENLFRQRQELSSKLLKEERAKGAIESKNIAMATLSHYVNNAAMAIYGRTQLLSKLLKDGNETKIIETLQKSIDVMENSILKISAVLAEMKDISPIDDVEFYDMSQAMKVDDRIERRMKEMLAEPEWETHETTV